MRRHGSSSRWPRWAAPTKPSAASRCSTRSTMRSTRLRPSTIGSSPMSWPPTSIRRRQGRSRRLDLVHRLGRLALPRRGRRHPRHQRRGKQITFRPKLPSHWDGYSATLKMLGAEVKVRVIRDKKAKTISLEVNGTKTKSSALSRKPATRSRWSSGYLREIKGLKHYLRALQGAQFSAICACAWRKAARPLRYRRCKLPVIKNVAAFGTAMILPQG